MLRASVANSSGRLLAKFAGDAMEAPLFTDFYKSRKITRLQTEKDSIPTPIRSGPAVSPHPPQPPAVTFKGIYGTCRTPRLPFAQTCVR